MLVGTIHKGEDGLLYNAMALLDGGKVAGVTLKHELPNYGTFDEKRVFAPGPLPGPLNIRGVRIGIPICEDMWFPHVTQCLAETGAEILVRSEEHTSELQSLMRHSYAVFCLKQKNKQSDSTHT